MDDTTTELVKAALAALLRHGLGAAGAALVTYGAIGSDQQNAFVTMASGIIIWGLSYGWSVLQKNDVIGKLMAFARIKQHLAIVPPVSPTVPQASAINAAIEVVKKAP